MPAVIKVMKAESILITLIKPQFEARRSQVTLDGMINCLVGVLVTYIEVNKSLNVNLSLTVLR
jgi:predicted rRNA methylase YqxC with S4 and FtsJ domains